MKYLFLFSDGIVVVVEIKASAVIVHLEHHRFGSKYIVLRLACLSSVQLSGHLGIYSILEGQGFLLLQVVLRQLHSVISILREILANHLGLIVIQALTPLSHLRGSLLTFTDGFFPEDCPGSTFSILYSWKNNQGSFHQSNKTVLTLPMKG